MSLVKKWPAPQGGTILSLQDLGCSVRVGEPARIGPDQLIAWSSTGN